MSKMKYLIVSAAGVVSIGAGAVGVVHATTNTQAKANSNKTIGSSGIVRSVMKQDRLTAEANVLNVTTASLQVPHRGKIIKQQLTTNHLTRKEFNQEVKAKLLTELQAQGYSSDQVTIATQARTIGHLKHKLHHDKKTEPKS